MNIIECAEITRIKKHELIPTIIDHVFTICKEDKNFKIKEDISFVESKLSLVNSKLEKQVKLSEQSDNIKKELLEKIRVIDDESFKLKYKILEFLGSEI
jgi:hypothetical protein